MINTETRTIRGREFTVTEFPARRRLALQYRVMKVLGPFLGTGLGSLQGGASGSILDAKFDGDAIGKAVQRAFETLPERDFTALVDELLTSTRVDNLVLDKPQAIDAAFTGPAAIAEMLEVIGFVWEVNFGPLPLERFTSMLEKLTAPESANETPSGPPSEQDSSE